MQQFLALQVAFCTSEHRQRFVRSGSAPCLKTDNDPAPPTLLALGFVCWPLGRGWLFGRQTRVFVKWRHGWATPAGMFHSDINKRSSVSYKQKQFVTNDGERMFWTDASFARLMHWLCTSAQGQVGPGELQSWSAALLGKDFYQWYIELGAGGGCCFNFAPLL